MLFRSTLFLLILASPLFAGIEFLKTNVSEALEISKKENKPLMLSVHASW